MHVKKMPLSWQQIETECRKIALDISNSEFKPDYIVGLTRGGLVPAVMLSHLLKVPMHTLKVSLRDDDANGSETNCWMAEDVVDAKNILIVDDINDTGATLKWIREDWDKSVFKGDIAYWWHKRVKVAVLVNNLASNEDVDYWAFEVNKAEDDVWIEYPWEM